jgi:hypothetical protein
MAAAMVVLPLPLLLLASAAPPRLAVLEIKARVGVSQTLTQGISDELTAEVRRLNPSAKVYGSGEIRSLLEIQRQRTSAGCDADLACLAEIGGALGAESLVSSTLGKYGATYLLVVQLIDVRAARVVREATQKLTGKAEDELLTAVDKAVAQIFASNPLARVPPVATDLALGAGVSASPTGARATWPRWAFLGGAAVATGFAIAGAAVVAGYGSENAQVKAGQFPPNLTYSQYLDDRNAAGTWGTAALILAGVAVGCVTGSVLTW